MCCVFKILCLLGGVSEGLNVFSIFIPGILVLINCKAENNMLYYLRSFFFWVTSVLSSGGFRCNSNLKPYFCGLFVGTCLIFGCMFLSVSFSFPNFDICLRMSCVSSVIDVL